MKFVIKRNILLENLNHTSKAISSRNLIPILTGIKFDLKGKKRNQTINYPRQVAIYLCRTMTTESFPKIGSYFGGRDHSTIISAYQKIEDELEKNEQLQLIIEELKQSLST